MNIANKTFFAITATALAVSLALSEEAAKTTDFSSVTNFSTCTRQVRSDFTVATAAAVEKGDLKALESLLGCLSKSKVDGTVYDLWYKVAEQLNNAALTARKRPVEMQKELIAGFCAEGSTFGLNTAKLNEETAVDLGKQFADAAKGLLEKRMPQQDLTPALRLLRNRHVLSLQNKAGTRQGKLDAFRVVENDAFSFMPASRDETNAVIAAANDILRFRYDRKEWAEYAKICDRIAKERANVYPNAIAVAAYNKAAAFSQRENESEFSKSIQETDALPLNNDSLYALKAVRINEKEYTARLWKRFIDNRMKFAPKDRLVILGTMLTLADETTKGRLPKQPIDQARKVWNEITELQLECQAKWDRQLEAELAAKASKTPFKRDPAIVQLNISPMRMQYERILMAYHLYTEAFPFFEADVANPKVSANTLVDYARLCFLTRNKEKCRAAVECASTNSTLSVTRKFNLRTMLAVMDAKDQKDFSKRVAATRGDADIPLYFDCLRSSCRFLYELRSDIPMSEYITTLVDMSMELLWPEERIEYTAKFVANAPTTASGAYERNIFKELKTENRIEPYAIWDIMGGDWMGYGNRTKELKLLKSLEKPHLAADAKGKEGVVCACYDTTGVHFYLKLNDPDAWKTRAGLEDGLYLECSVQQGNESSWNWELFSALKPENQVDVEWLSPSFGRKMTHDYLKSDVFVADDCFVIHVFTPWIMAYDRIPSNKGDLWRFVAVARWAGEMRSLGGSVVHELGRGMHLYFDMSGKDLEQVKQGVLRAAAGEYLRFRKEWENADFWDDPNMGDPAFYAEVVKGYLQELDAVAKEAASPDLTPADVERLSKYLKDLGDCRLSLDAKRSEYIKQMLFKE